MNRLKVNITINNEYHYVNCVLELIERNDSKIWYIITNENISFLIDCEDVDIEIEGYANVVKGIVTNGHTIKGKGFLI